ncbi:MAG: hypothetical protein SFV81_09065 [Pirellulaceae bacterium]|nr:hypothetical protein [Pirellulaceae bacterium]
MSSPLATFRKHRTYWMAGLVLLAIMAFVVAPAIDFMQGAMQNYNSIGDQVVVRWKGGRITMSELERSRQHHYKFIRFLSALSREVLEAGGQPQIPEFAFSAESKQIIDLGVNVQSSSLAVIETRMLADFAKSNGIEFDDDAADQFLVAFCDKCVSPQRLTELLRESTDNQVTEFDLREMIKLELGAIVARQMALRGWSNDFKPDDYQRVRLTQTPGDMWSDFLKLNQSAKVEAYPVLVSDFVKSVTGEPTEAEILAIYEKGKNRIPSPVFPEPGFMRDYKANFEYVEGNFSDWIAKEKAKVTEEQLKAEYDKLISLGQLKFDPLLDKPKTPSDAPASETPAATPTDPAATIPPATTPPAAESPATPPATDPASTPAPPTPAPETPATEKPAAEKPATEAPATEPPAPAGDAPVATPDPKQQSSTKSGVKIRLVSAQDEPKPAEPTAPATETPAAATPAAQEPAQEPAPAVPAPAPAAETPAATPATQEPATQDPAGLPPVVVQPAAPGAETPSAPATEAKPADGAAAPGTETKPEKRNKTFEEAREELLESLARTAVIDALQKELTSANDQMLKYSQAYRQQAALLKEGLQPETKATRPDLRKVVEAGLKYGETGMVDRSKLYTTEIGKSTMSLQEQGMGQIPMPNYGMNNPNYGLFTPAQSLFFDQMAMLEQRTPDFRQYIFWKVDDQQAYDPDLAEVSEEVIAAGKKKKAIQIASDEAAKIAKKVKGAEEPWKEALNVTQQSLLVTTDPFTWLSGFGETPRISNVPTLDTVGQEFMQKVFTTPVGNAGVAPNQGQNIYYVYRVAEVTPTTSELEARFAADPNKMAARRVGLMTGQQIYTGLYETIENRLAVKWEISPTGLDE